MKLRLKQNGKFSFALFQNFYSPFNIAAKKNETEEETINKMQYEMISYILKTRKTTKQGSKIIIIYLKSLWFEYIFSDFPSW